MKLSDYVFKFLEEKGTENVFFVPGGGCMHLLNTLAESENIKGINLLHEQAAAIAAESYAFTSGKVGVALVTTGPGGTNTVTGVLSAYLDSIPCLFISGQVKTTDLKDRFGVRSHGSQEADIVGIVEKITKYSVMVKDKKDIKYHLERAWYEATTGRKGPVWIDIPLDVQGSDVEADELKGYEIVEAETKSFEKELGDIIKLIENADRPVILAGNGLRGCEAEFKTLVNKLGIPVIPSWKAVDLMANDDTLFAGKCGLLGERASNFALQTSDLVISLGCKLDLSITGYDRKRFAPLAKKVIVDIDENEINKLGIDVDVKVVGDVSEIVKGLNEADIFLKEAELAKWRDRIKAWLDKYPVKALFKNEGLISTYELVETLSELSDKNSLYVPASAGTVAEIFYQALKLKEGQKVRSNHGLGSMGYELPAAIGACIASKRPVICVAGDGGMQLNVQELAVIAGRKLPIKIFVVNNGGYSSIRNMQRNHFNGRYIASNEETGLYIPDMKALAAAYGVNSSRIEEESELYEGVKEALEADGPFLCDVVIDPMCTVAPRSTTKVLADGSIVSTPLEDLFPFLPEEELKKEMEGFV